MSCNNKDLDFIKLTALPPIVEPNKAYLIKENKGTFTMYMTDKDCKVFGLESSGYTLDFNEDTNILSLRNAGGVVSQVDLSSLAQAEGIVSVDVDGVTINFRDSAGDVIDSIQLGVSNIVGLQDELDEKEDLINKVTDLNSPNNLEYPTTQAVYDAIQGFVPDLTDYVSYNPQSKLELQKQQARTNIGVYSTQEIQNFLDGSTPINGYNKTNWDTAFSWGDWSVGVNKAYVDLLNVDADTLDGLDSTDFVTVAGTQSITGDKSFTTGVILPNAVDTGGTITSSTRIPIIGTDGLVNSYTDLEDLFALNPPPPTPTLDQVLTTGNITTTGAIFRSPTVSADRISIIPGDSPHIRFQRDGVGYYSINTDASNRLYISTPIGDGSGVSGTRMSFENVDTDGDPEAHVATFYGRVKGEQAKDEEDYPTYGQLLDAITEPDLQQVTEVGRVTDQGLVVTGVGEGVDLVNTGLQILYDPSSNGGLITALDQGNALASLSMGLNFMTFGVNNNTGDPSTQPTNFVIQPQTSAVAGVSLIPDIRISAAEAINGNELVTLDQLTAGLNNVNITESQITDFKDYLRGDVNDTNGANKLTLGSLEVVGQTTLQNGLNMSSVLVGTSDSILTLNQVTGDVEQRVFNLGDIDIANEAGVSQFPVGLGDQLRIQGSGDTSISFDGATNTININSIPGSGGAGAVTSFNGRDGAVVAEAGDYSTALVNENTNLYFTEPRVRSTSLTGLAIANTPISSTNTFLQAFGRLQGQINDRSLLGHTHTTSDITDLSSYTGFDSRYVNVTGDIMTGDLTLGGTASIKLASNNTTIVNNSGATVLRNNGTATVLASQNETIYLRPQGDSVSQSGAEFRTNGDLVIFGGNVTANALIANGNGDNIITTGNVNVGGEINIKKTKIRDNGYNALVISQNTSEGSGGNIFLRPGGDTSTSNQLQMSSLTGAVFSGNVTASNFILSSDRRLKENIESLGNGYYTFNFIDDETKRKRYGAMADEVKEYAPELIYENEEGYKQVGYIDFLIKKIAELENKINSL